MLHLLLISKAKYWSHSSVASNSRRHGGYVTSLKWDNTNATWTIDKILTTKYPNWMDDSYLVRNSCNSGLFGCQSRIVWRLVTMGRMWLFIRNATVVDYQWISPPNQLANNKTATNASCEKLPYYHPFKGCNAWPKCMSCILIYKTCGDL